MASSAPAAPRGCTNFKLRRLTRRVTRHYDRAVGEAGLKTTQYSLLSHLVALGPVRPGELARRMDMDASTLTRNLQPLVAQGWARVGPGDDGRSRVVAVTDAGRAKRDEARGAWQRAQRSLDARLGEERAARLHALLDECLALVDESEGDTHD